MCRYGMNMHEEPYACFRYRKSFKQTNRHELPPGQRPEGGEPRVVPCPQCGEQMASMGHDFKPPPMKSVKQWQKVRLLFENGFTFHSCGGGVGHRPKELREVEAIRVDLGISGHECSTIAAMANARIRAPLGSRHWARKV